MSLAIPVAAFRYQLDARDAIRENEKFERSVSSLSKVSLGNLISEFVSIENLAKRVAPLFGGIALGSFGLDAIRVADQLGDLAERMEISVESMSKLQYVAQQNDVEFSELTTAVKAFQIGLGEASRGTGTMRTTLDQLNLSVEDLIGLPLEDQLALIADRFNTVVPAVDRANVAQDLFKRGGQAMIPILKGGGDAIRALAQQAEQLGLVLTERGAEGIDRMTKAVDRLKLSAKIGFAGSVGSLFADIVGTGDELADTEARIERVSGLLEDIQKSQFAPAQGLLLPLAGTLALLTKRMEELKASTSGTRFEMELLPLPWLKSGREDEIQEFQVTAKKIDEDAEAFRKIMRDINESVLKDRDDLLRLYADSERDVSSLVAQDQREMQSEVTEHFNSELQKRIEAARNAREYEREEEQKFQNDLLSIRAAGAAAAQTLLTAYGGKFSAVAKAILAAEAGFAIKSIFVNTQEGMSKAIAKGGPWGYALAAGIALYGAARIAAVASTVAGAGSSSSVGSPHNPVATRPESPDMPASTPDTSSQRVVQIHIHGSIYSGRETAQFMLETIQQAVNENDVVVINPNSRQAAEIRGDA